MIQGHLRHPPAELKVRVRIRAKPLKLIMAHSFLRALTGPKGEPLTIRKKIGPALRQINKPDGSCYGLWPWHSCQWILPLSEEAFEALNCEYCPGCLSKRFITIDTMEGMGGVTVQKECQRCDATWTEDYVRTDSEVDSYSDCPPARGP